MNQEQQWEYAEVRCEASYPGCSGILIGVFFNLLDRYQFRLEATAHGPRGSYHVTYSPLFIAKSEVCSLGAGAREGEDAIAALINEMIQDGWQLVEQGPLWWQARFERPVTN